MIDPVDGTHVEDFLGEDDQETLDLANGDETTGDSGETGLHFAARQQTIFLNSIQCPVWNQGTKSSFPIVKTIRNYLRSSTVYLVIQVSASIGQVLRTNLIL